MKKTILLTYLALLLSFLPPLFLPLFPAAPEAPAPASLPAEDPPTPGPTLASPCSTRLRVLREDELWEVDMQDYLFGVLAAEMPASFEPEALKAQAVAARTYALYCAACHKHAQADVCTDHRCCQAWQGDDALREAWGSAYEANRAKLLAAVRDTDGQYLSYEGQPVFAAFHSSSAGATEACGQIWNPLPYLISVPSPESAETVPNYVSELVCSPLDFRDVLLSAYPQADFTGPEETWIGPLSQDESGRVTSALLGGVEIPGTQLRSLFSLRSTAFTLRYDGACFFFTVTGSGHGVGMSQYGAQVMAGQGAGYAEILAHYYPGTTLLGL